VTACGTYRIPALRHLGARLALPQTGGLAQTAGATAQRALRLESRCTLHAIGAPSVDVDCIGTHSDVAGCAAVKKRGLSRLY